jgi:hypothetical protein
MELYFFAPGRGAMRLIMMFTDDYEIDRLERRGSGLILDPWILTPGQTLRQVQATLRELHRPFVVVPGPYGWRVSRIVRMTGSGAEITFYNERYRKDPYCPKPRIRGRRVEFLINSLCAFERPQRKSQDAAAPALGG